MSLEREETLKCPKCKTENKFRIYDSINVTLDPELKKKVLDGSLFKMKCAERKPSSITLRFIMTCPRNIRS